MKRYLVFAYDDFYPEGGSHDFRGDFDTHEDINRWLIQRLADSRLYPHVEVLDLTTGEWDEIDHFEVASPPCTPFTVAVRRPRLPVEDNARAMEFALDEECTFVAAS